MIRIHAATYGALHYVLSNLCDGDRTELLATCWQPEKLAEELATRIMARNGMALVASEERPITAFGLVPLCPGVGVAFAFSTTEYARSVIPVTRWIRTIGTTFAIRAGYHRIEARAMQRPYFDRWMRLVGAKAEAKLECFGKGGEDFILYRWLAREHAQQSRTTHRPVAAGNGR
jgi:hypothetical protein